MAQRRSLSYEEAVDRMQRYCAYQERCHYDVRYKLIGLGIRGVMVEEIITHLIEEKYLDETRYALAYARGKLKMNGWGWQKIRLALKQKRISDYDLKQARSEIDGEQYDQILQQIIAKKNATLKESNPAIRKKKLYRFALSRGFEAEKIKQAIESLSGNS